jgi:hypothetical protein
VATDILALWGFVVTAATGTWLLAKNGLQFFLKIDRKRPLGSFQALGGPFGFLGRFWDLFGLFWALLGSF